MYSHCFLNRSRETRMNLSEKLGRFEKLHRNLLTFKTYISLKIQVTKQTSLKRFPLFVFSLMNIGRRKVVRSDYFQFFYFDVSRAFP
jgi:hypothetical protein